MVVKKERIILHVDMDHFFTAVEERERPEIRGKPVVVGADPKEGKGRGVAATCNYEARKYGVKSGMPIARAWRLCPHAVYLHINYRLYKSVSARIMTILRGYADKFESWGIDEAFLEVSSRAKNLKEAERLAQEIKNEIHVKEKLTCSIGIGPNKLVAKIASDFKKPDGLTIVEVGNVKSFLSPLPVGRLLWVGRKTEQKLREIGIQTIGDLANYDMSVLKEKFGIMGMQMHLSAQGIDNSEIHEEWEIKSISRERTFEEDTDEPDIIYKALDDLSVDVHKRLTKSNFNFKTVTIKIRYENFETHTHGRTLPFFTSQLNDINKISQKLMQDHLQPERKIRLVGVKLSNLISRQKQKTLA